jgi:hypothetical protein
MYQDEEDKTQATAAASKESTHTQSLESESNIIPRNAEDDAAQVIASLDAMSLSHSSKSAAVRYDRNKRKHNFLAADPHYRRNKEKSSGPPFSYFCEGVLMDKDKIEFAVGVNGEASRRNLAIQRQLKQARASKKGLFGTKTKTTEEHAPGDSPPVSPLSNNAETPRNFRPIKNMF